MFWENFEKRKKETLHWPHKFTTLFFLKLFSVGEEVEESQ
jgi:hypothetical protein